MLVTSYSENALGARTSVRPARWQHRAGRNKFRAPPSSPRVSRLSERRHPCRPPRAFHPLWRTKFMETRVVCYFINSLLRASRAGFSSSLAVLGLATVYPAVAGELQWEQGPGYRSAALSIPSEGRNGFTRVPGSVSGILFTNVLSQESGLKSQLRLAGSGVAAGDVDADGRCDLYFCGMEGGNRLYRNLGA